MSRCDQCARASPLSTVTTASLAALRRYSEAVKLSEAGAYPQAIALLDEAVQLDTAFAMAYRKLSALHFNSGDLRGMGQACRSVVAHLDRLTEKEGYLALAQCGELLGRTRVEAMQALQSVLRLDPFESAALNNLAYAYQDLDRFEEAGELLERAVSNTVAVPRTT
ncbi:MAG: tetratricopeptide repeat protein [Longimicrobiales bacterium]